MSSYLLFVVAKVWEKLPDSKEERVWCNDSVLATPNDSKEAMKLQTNGSRTENQFQTFSKALSSSPFSHFFGLETPHDVLVSHQFKTV